MLKLIEIIDAIYEAIAVIPVIFGAVGFVLGYLLAIIPLTTVKYISFWLKIWSGQGFNEMAFDVSHPDFDVNDWRIRNG